MSYCLNSECYQPKNPQGTHICLCCGSKLLLKERYRAIQFLGEGGFGRTFKAVDEQRLNTPCVIKQFLPHTKDSAALSKATQLFEQEAHQLLHLGKHPQIPDLLAYFEQDQRLYLIQEYIHGQDLIKELRQEGTFSEAKIFNLLIQLLEVLQFIHEQKIIHRDIKPENIIRRLPDSDPLAASYLETSQLFLIDFGISKPFQVGLKNQTAGTIIGTLGYAPIEQMRGVAYPASDLYSLGVTCIRLLTGCLPKEDGCDELYDAMQRQWLWREKLKQRGIVIHEALERILAKLLQENLCDRYQSAREVLAELQTLNPLTFSTSSSLSVPVSSIVALAKTTLSPKITSNLEISLASEVGANYHQLQHYLEAQQWQAADRETTRIMLLLAGREKLGWLDSQTVETFPSADLQTIDQLWVNYSQGHFGFSVQKQIWQQMGRKHTYDFAAIHRFGEKVGWRSHGKWLDYQDLTFSMTAPAGHLPLHFTSRWGAGFEVSSGWCVQSFNALLSRREL
jgi:serine/threonine protein kinase